MRVKNLNGINRPPCKCGSWLDHWKNFSHHELPAYCPENKCAERPEVGVLCQRDDLPLPGDEADARWYVIPLCRKHSVSTEPLDVYVTLVSADIARTCGPLAADELPRRGSVAGVG